MAHRFLHRTMSAAVLAIAALTLAACAGSTSLDELDSATPAGSAFTRQLFKNYSFLARSFGTASTGGFDRDSDTIFGGGATDDLAEAFATKALIAAQGTEVDPEPGRDSESAAARDRLMRALSAGKDRFPVDAARAQTDFDCWMLNAAVDGQAAAAAQCRSSFGATIARLERDIAPPLAAAPAPAAAPPADYTVYFDLDSWSLSGEQLTVLQKAIDTARAGGQSRITIVGHTDTSGSATYNKRLSLKRANVVAETLVTMGARRDAIEISGVGESDLAVQTPDGTKEPKNRRAVVTLVP
jgi:OOP family OmpA-OmpF porin